jgi:rSAM/selenodomain-associated transferase 1
MSSRPTIIVFLRAPYLGAVKQRLAAGVGMAEARRFYAGTTQRLLRRLGRAPHWDVRLAVTPDQAADHGRFWPAHLKRFAQGQGDLGLRMTRAFACFPNRPVVLIGSDIPDLSADHIGRAFTALGRCDLTFGPARDGGYWLVGARESSMVRGLFKNVRWSSSQALADTLANAGTRRVQLLDCLDDIDDAEDLARWRAMNNQGIRADRESQ